jgi:hypothetical protein
MTAAGRPANHVEASTLIETYDLMKTAPGRFSRPRYHVAKDEFVAAMLGGLNKGQAVEFGLLLRDLAQAGGAMNYSPLGQPIARARELYTELLEQSFKSPAETVYAAADHLKDHCRGIQVHVVENGIFALDRAFESFPDNQKLSLEKSFVTLAGDLLIQDFKTNHRPQGSYLDLPGKIQSEAIRNAVINAIVELGLI